MKIRTVKPAFWQSETLAGVSRDARLLFIGLFNRADDEGRFRAHPALVRGELFAFDDDADVGSWLEELASAGVIDLYEVGGTSYGVVRNFAEHQKIDKRRESDLPAPPRAPQAPTDPSAPIPLRSAPEDRRAAPENGRAAPDARQPAPEKGRGREGKGREEEGIGARADARRRAGAPPSVCVERPPDVPEADWSAWLEVLEHKRKRLTPELWSGVTAAAKSAGAAIGSVVRTMVERQWAHWDPSYLGKGKAGGGGSAPRHVPNMPLGSPNCECAGCVEFRRKQASRAQEAQGA